MTKLLICLSVAVSLSIVVYAHSHTSSSSPIHSFLSSITTQLPFLQSFAVDLQSHPGLAALLSTLFISVAPLIFLVSLPAELSTNSLKVAVAFASGGLLGDVFLHMIPEVFEHHSDHETMASSLDKGLAVVYGFVTFFVLEKTLRIASGARHSHSHGHSHQHEESQDEEIRTPSKTSSRKRGGKKLLSSPEVTEEEVTSEKEGTLRRSTRLRRRVPDQQEDDKQGTSKTTKKKTVDHESKDNMNAVLSLIADASHNFTDGLAISSSMYHSPGLGLSTTLAIFCHEIPHEIGDYAILRKNGFSRTRAILAQLVTAGGAFMGTIVGIVIEEIALSHAANITQDANDWASWFVSWIQWVKVLLVPFSAGSFIYIASVGVIPELLELDQPDTKQKPTLQDKRKLKLQQFVQMVKELLAMGLGIWMMWFFAVVM
jgi:zinc transporter 7